MHDQQPARPCAGHKCPKCRRIHTCATGCEKAQRFILCGQCDTKPLFELREFIVKKNQHQTELFGD